MNVLARRRSVDEALIIRKTHNTRRVLKMLPTLPKSKNAVTTPQSTSINSIRRTELEKYCFESYAMILSKASKARKAVQMILDRLTT